MQELQQFKGGQDCVCVLLGRLAQASIGGRTVLMWRK
jgi:hypothetical protein